MDRLLVEWERACSSSLVRNAGWMFLGQGLSIICQGVYFILLARLLGPTEYGIYAGVFAMTAVISPYSSLGSAFTLIRYVSTAVEKFAAYWGNVLMTTLALGASFAVVLVIVAPHLVKTYSWKLVLCAAISDCLCAQLTDAGGRVFQAFEKLHITASITLLTNLLRTGLAALLLWQFYHVTAAQWVTASLAVSLAAVVGVVLLLTRRFGKPTFDLRLLAQHVKEGCLFAMSSSASGFYNNFDKVMLGHYGMNAANGIYTMAYRIVDTATIPVTSVHAAAFPQFFQKGAAGIYRTSAFAVNILKRTAPCALLMTFAMLILAPIIPRLVGGGFAPSVAALRWLCLLPVFRSIHLSAGDALTGAGHLNLRVSLQIVAAVFNFGVNLYLIPHYGWHGAAWSSLITDGLLGIADWAALLAVCSLHSDLVGVRT